MDNWISVKDRLPEDSSYVLCFMDNDDSAGCYDTVGFFNGKFYSYVPNIGFCERHHVTHWLPLTKPNEKD